MNSAIFKLLKEEWRMWTNTYGFAVQLKPYVGKGNTEIDKYFGRALKCGTSVNSSLFYKGLYWMDVSGGLQVKYPNANQSFQEFVTSYLQSSTASYFKHDKLWFVGSSVVLAPSKEVWEIYKLAKLNIRSTDIPIITFDKKRIQELLKFYDISGVVTDEFIEDRRRNTINGVKCGFIISSLSIYSSPGVVYMEDISIRQDTLEIYKSFKHPDFQPVIDFVETVMIASGSPSSANAWIRKEKDE